MIQEIDKKTQWNPRYEILHLGGGGGGGEHDAFLTSKQQQFMFEGLLERYS